MKNKTIIMYEYEMIFKLYCGKCKWKTRLIPLFQSTTLVAFEASGTAVILGLLFTTLLNLLFPGP